MAALTLKRSKNFVVNKMVELGMIADRSEIMPAKKKRYKKSNNTEPGDISDESDGGDDPSEPTAMQKNKKNFIASTTRPAKPKINKSLDVHKLRGLITALKVELQPVLLWLEESLNDAAEDMTEDPSDDPDDCVPLVPFTRDQCGALGNEDFKALLKGLGFQESETYWRIPQHLTAVDIKLRAQIVAGTFDEGNETEKLDSGVNNEIDANEGEDELTASQRSRVENIIYNDSDNDETPRAVVPPKAKKSARRDKVNKKFDIFDMVKAPDDADDLNDADTVQSTPDDVNEVTHRSRMAALVDSDDSNDEPKKQKRARRIVVIASSDDDDDGGSASLQIDEGHSSHRIDDDDDTTITAAVGLGKRDRSDSEESIEPNTNQKPKRKRAAIIDDDEDDE